MLKKVSSPILKEMIYFNFWVLNVLAIYFILRGHYQPGGAFIAGLLTAIAFLLKWFTLGEKEIQKIFGLPPDLLAAIGGILSLSVGFYSIIQGGKFFEHFYWKIELGAKQISIGTALIFDVGVYFVVVGITCMLLLKLTKSINQELVFKTSEENRYKQWAKETLEKNEEN